MSEKQEIFEKWSKLKSKYELNQGVIDAEGISKIEGLLSHKDVEYILQGWQLLLSFGVEQICRYVKMKDGVGWFCGDFKKRDSVERVLFDRVVEFDELTKLYELGAFDRMEGLLFERLTCNKLSDRERERVLRKSQEMVLIPKGSFVMGAFENDNTAHPDENPRHTVTLNRDFWMGKYQVTQTLWESVTGSRYFDYKGSNRPVVSMCWIWVVSFCNQLSLKEGLKPVYTINGKDVKCDWRANGYRLPTEAEWEYAAKGGESYLYAGSDDIDEVAWYYDSRDALDTATRAVGLKKENGFGLHDMSGNVEEWCWDWYGYYGNASVVDPRGPESGLYRVFRGGAFNSYPKSQRVSFRDYADPYVSRPTNRSFRLSRNVE